MTLITARGTKEFCRDFRDIYIDSFNYFDVEFVFRNWKGISLARYNTPAQVETVITMLKNTIARGEKEFTFPTVEQLNALSERKAIDARMKKIFIERGEFYDALDEADELWIKFENLKKVSHRGSRGKICPASQSKRFNHHRKRYEQL